MPFPLPGPGSAWVFFCFLFFPSLFFNIILSPEIREKRGRKRMGRVTKCATLKESRFSRGFLVNLATAAREATSSRDTVPALTLCQAAVSRRSNYLPKRRRLNQAKEAGGLTYRPRPTQGAARGCNGPTHRQRKGSGKSGIWRGMVVGRLQRNRVRSPPRKGGKVKASATLGLEGFSLLGRWVRGFARTERPNQEEGACPAHKLNYDTHCGVRTWP